MFQYHIAIPFCYIIHILCYIMIVNPYRLLYLVSMTIFLWIVNISTVIKFWNRFYLIEFSICQCIQIKNIFYLLFFFFITIILCMWNLYKIIIIINMPFIICYLSFVLHFVYISSQLILNIKDLLSILTVCHL